MQRLTLAFVAFEEFGIVVGFAIHALPGEQRVIAGRQAAQSEASPLIGNRLSIAIGMAAEARFGYGDHYRIGNELVLLIGGYALGDGSVSARQQVKRARTATHAES